MARDAETDFNASMRAILRAQGLGAIHLVQCDQPGPADLLVWQLTQGIIVGWLELKIDNEELRPSQVEFLRDVDQQAGNAFVVRLRPTTGIITVERPKQVGGWSTDRKALGVVHSLASIAEVDWAVSLARWRRPLRLSRR